MRERPVYLRLTEEQVEPIRYPVRGNVVARLMVRLRGQSPRERVESIGYPMRSSAVARQAGLRGRSARERRVCVRLNAEQVALVMDPSQGYTLEKLIALLSGWIPREGIPQIEVWDELARGKLGERFSVELARGLLLLAHLADRQPVNVTDLSWKLHIEEGAANLYLQTLLMSGLVERDPDTQLYRLAG